MVYFTIIVRYWKVPLKGERQTTTEDMAIKIRDQIREDAEKNGLFHQYLHRENVTVIVTAASVDSTISTKNVKSTETRLPVKQTTTGAEPKTVGLTMPSNEPTTTSEDMTTTIKQQTTEERTTSVKPGQESSTAISAISTEEIVTTEKSGQKLKASTVLSPRVTSNITVRPRQETATMTSVAPIETTGTPSSAKTDHPVDTSTVRAVTVTQPTIPDSRARGNVLS